MAHCTIINQIKDEYDLLGEIEVDKIKEKLSTYKEAYDLFESIIDNRLIEDTNLEVSNECIMTIIDYWKEVEKKDFLKKALKNTDETDAFVEAVRKYHNREDLPK